MPEEEVVTPEATEDPEQPESSAVSEAATAEHAESEGEREDKPKGGGFQRRIDKLTREKYELSGAVREMRERLARLEERKDSAPEAKKETGAPKPKVEDFKTMEDWIEAVTDWKLAKTQEAQAKATQEAQEREVLNTYRERVVEFAKEHADYEDVIASVRLRESLLAPVQLCLLEDENGPALTYYLGENPEVVSKLNTMTEREAMRYLGRLSERLFPETADDELETEEASEPEEEEAAPKPKPRTQASAPPLKPVKKPSPALTGPRDSEPIDAWMAKRGKQLESRG